uniref:Putative ovule protein n=1 Tax=Solanum chacoense TaxID=4108 RepID=A0A0V0HAK0_SOLCH
METKQDKFFFSPSLFPYPITIIFNPSHQRPLRVLWCVYNDMLFPEKYSNFGKTLKIITSEVGKGIEKFFNMLLYVKQANE